MIEITSLYFCSRNRLITKNDEVRLLIPFRRPLVNKEGAKKNLQTAYANYKKTWRHHVMFTFFPP